MSKTAFPTLELQKAGQSPWLDYISRDLLNSGKLKSFIEEAGLLGVTSNPSIFEKAINQPESGYEKEIQKLIRGGASTFEIYDALTVSDIQKACDLFLPVFQKSKGEHGFVSLEVMPGLADYEDDTIREAKRLFKKVSRPNVMIKVPATPAGVSAVRELIACGININITLMFSVRHYQEVAQAYLDGLDAFAKKGGDVGKVHSVASVFVSRIDTLIDKQLPLVAQDSVDASIKREIENLAGKAAVANSKLIYQEYKKYFNSTQWKRLKAKGAWVQKVLWGSTSVKNTAYSDLLYVEDLIGPETVNTMPQVTLEAFLDHGRVNPGSIEAKVSEASAVIDRLQGLGFDLNAIGDKLQKDGAKLFCDSFDSLMRSLEKIRLSQIIKKQIPLAKIKINHALSQQESILEKVTELEQNHSHERFLQKDPSLWKEDLENQKVIANRLGWLHAAEWILARLYELDLLREELNQEGFQDLVLLGMGGSSLASEVLYSLFSQDRTQSKIRFHLLDTTDPGTLLKLESKLKLNKTIFLVASKSGTTAETVAQYRYFYARVSRLFSRAGADAKKKTGRHFIAVTDEGSLLEREAKENLFRRVLINPTDIGGRYSALSYFGLTPAALCGLPVRDIVYQAQQLFNATQLETSLEKNPGMSLGIILGQLALEGKNKLYIWTTPKLAYFSDWLEQLIAESTGKEGRGIVPVIREISGSPAEYNHGSVILALTLKGDSGAKLKQQVKTFTKAGFPVVEMEWPDAASVGAEFLRWEIVTSFASLVLGINPFDEPNVKESKDITGKLLNELKTKKGKNLLAPSGLSLDKKNPLLDGKKINAQKHVQDYFALNRENGYIAILSYTERSPEVAKALQKIQALLRTKYKIPVLFGFGPRYLHSIGQLYKGGPKTGMFVQLLIQDPKDALVPGSHFSFSQLKRCQALGDLLALKEKNLPVLSVYLGKNPLQAFTRFTRLLT